MKQGRRVEAAVAVAMHLDRDTFKNFLVRMSQVAS
jgi:hypothetical protein